MAETKSITTYYSRLCGYFCKANSLAPHQPVVFITKECFSHTAYKHINSNKMLQNKMLQYKTRLSSLAQC